MVGILEEGTSLAKGQSRQNSSSRITGADVAARAGVDAAVVSKILKGDPKLRISERTRKRVMDAINELGYRPNYAAQRLRSSVRIRAVGLIIPNFSNPAYAEIVHGAEIGSLKKKVTLFVSSTEEFKSPLDLVIDFVASERVDALLIAGGTARETALINKYLSERNFPFLFLNRESMNPKRSLFLDDEYAVKLMVHHLYDLGHRNIYNIAGRKSMETGKRRIEGFRDAIEEVGLPFKETLIYEEEYSAVGGQKAYEAVMKRRPRPTALVISEFVMAVGAMNAARNAGIRVPDDLSIVAFNNLEIASMLNPTLSTVGLQLQHLGEEGFDLLIDTPEDVEIYRTISKKARLFPRESSKAI